MKEMKEMKEMDKIKMDKQDILLERYELALGRIREMPEDKLENQEIKSYFDFACLF